MTRVSELRSYQPRSSVYERITQGGRTWPVRKWGNWGFCQRTSTCWNWNSYWITSQHLWTNCTTKQSSSQTATYDKFRCDRCRLQRQSEGGHGQPRRPTIPSGKGRPNHISDYRKDRQLETRRSRPIGWYQEWRPGIGKLQHHYGPKS